jgi:4-hydroxy-tetrahydrodipicolinate reductase
VAPQPLKIAIAGAQGRMGQAVARVADGDESLVIVGRIDRPELGLTPVAEALAAADVVIDFSTASAATALAAQCALAGVALVVGATGFEDDHLAAFAKAAKQIPVVRAGNYSLGVNMLMGLVRQAAGVLGAADWDVEVFEAHHRRKVDAPSGTALMLGEAAAQGRGVNLADVAMRVRDGMPGARPTGEIGFSVLRGGGIVGEHSVVFAAEDEILTLSHSARDRSLFARGALAAARWVVGKPAGEYDMQDVLGFTR